MQRRLFIQSLAATASTSALPLLAQTAKPQVEVWKDPSCGCCKDWIAHMQSSGFSVKSHDSGNTAARARLGLPQSLVPATPPWWVAMSSKAMYPPAT
jgi:hypothetical protein